MFPFLNHPINKTLSRRRFLSAATAATAGAGLGSSTLTPSALAQNANAEASLTGPYNFTKPYDWLAAYAKVRGRLDGQVGLYHYVAHIYGVPEGGVAQLMFRREGVSQHRMTVRKDRTLDLQYVECNYTQHPETGALIDDFYDNPLTGELVPIRHQAPVPGPLVRINPTGGFTPDIQREPPAAFVNPVGPPLFGEGRVFFNDDILMYTPGPENTPGRHLTELITFSADIRDVQNPELMSAKSFAYIAATTPWSDWLNMGDRPGHMMMRYLAEKIATVDEIPSWLRKRIDTDHPKFFTESGI
ncbi:MAG: DUF1838 family protein [Rhodospirillaceae bacterium]